MSDRENTTSSSPYEAPASAHEHFEEGEEKAPPGTRLMGVVRWILVVGMGLLAVASVLYWIGLHQDDGAQASAEAKVRYQCPMHPQVIQDAPGDCPICNMKLIPVAASNEAPKTRYQCPMHPEVIQDEPGTCPTCKMKLVAVAPEKKAQGDVPGLTQIQLSQERIQLSGVRTAAATKAELTQALRTVGYVSADETSIAEITTRFAGWIEELPASTTGERVTKGQVLASIYSPELLAAEGEFLNAIRWKVDAGEEETHAHVGRLSGGLADDARRRLELLGVSAEDIQEVERQGKPIHAVTLRSPVSGYVTKKTAVRGTYIEPGTNLFEIADLGHVWVLADVYEYELAHVEVGQKAKLKLVPYPDRTFEGRVEFIYPVVDPDTRTMRVRLHFQNRDLTLRPGMYGDVTIERPAVEAVVIPHDALVDTGKYQYVFLAKSGGRFEPRQVKTGRHAEDQIEILEGVKAGDVVVTTANFLVDSESRLRATIEGFSAEPPSHEHGGHE